MQYELCINKGEGMNKILKFNAILKTNSLFIRNVNNNFPEIVSRIPLDNHIISELQKFNCFIKTAYTLTIPPALYYGIKKLNYKILEEF